MLLDMLLPGVLPAPQLPPILMQARFEGGLWGEGGELDKGVGGWGHGHADIIQQKQATLQELHHHLSWICL